MLNSNAQKWVDAIRSGKYKQTTAKLSDGQSYCCLGVACELAMDSGVALYKQVYNGGVVLYNGCQGMLPAEVKRWLRLDDSGSYAEGMHIALVSLNDTGKSFKEIADFIEGNQDKLFYKGDV